MRYIISLAAASLLAALPAAAEPPRVVADIPPVHSLVAQVMGDIGAPVLLLDRGGDAHDFALRPAQASAVASADLVVWMGPAMSPWLDRVLAGADGDAAGLDLMEVPGTVRRATAEAPDGADAGHDHGHDDHDHGAVDPHAWLDPGNAVLWLRAIAAELGRLDPAHAAAYAANAEAAAAGVAALDSGLSALLAPARNRPLIVQHDAYGYFAGHYGLTLLEAIAPANAAAPGAARLAGIAARAGQAACVYPEAGRDAGLAERLAEDAGLPLGPPLDPEGRLLEPGAGLYAALLRGLAEGIAACLAPR